MKKTKCQECGDEDPANFYVGRKNLCKGCFTKRMKEAYQENRDEKIAYQKEWNAKNRHKCQAYKATKNHKRKHRKVSWLSKEDKGWMSEIYRTAIEVSKVTGEPHHVDHIVPLLGKTVSGLHVPWNLQIIPAQENILKKNVFDS